MYMLRKIPKRTDSVKYAGYKFEVVDIDSYKIDQLLVTGVEPASNEKPAQESQRSSLAIMKMNTIPVRWPVALALALGACSQKRTAQNGDACQTRRPQPAGWSRSRIPMRWCKAPWQSPARCSTRSITARIKGRLNRSPPPFARGYIESAMRETMLAAVHSDYPLLGMRDVRLTDPVAKFLTSAQARTTAHDYLMPGAASAGPPSAPPSGSRSGRAIPSRAGSPTGSSRPSGCWPGAEPLVIGGCARLDPQPQEATPGGLLSFSAWPGDACAGETSPCRHHPELARICS